MNEPLLVSRAQPGLLTDEEAGSSTVTFQVVAGTDQGFDLAFQVRIDRSVYYYTITTVKDISVGEILDAVVENLGLGSKPELWAPWDRIYDVRLKPALTMAMGSGARDIQGVLEFTNPLDLTFLKVNSLTLYYGGKGFDFGAGIEFMGREQVLEYPFATPVPPPGGFKLHYFGLGQRLAIPTPGDPPAIAGVVDRMKEDLGQIDGEDLSKAFQYYDPSAGWLVAADAELVDTFRLRVVFNDPVLYGISIDISADWAKGFHFEIVYAKVSDEVGVYYLDLTLPAALRQLEFGSVSVTLPSVALWIYTNGDFRIAVGWPLGERSIAVQVLPFIGSAGFYFGKLSGASSRDVPNPELYGTILEIGLALSIGLGKSIQRGIFSASLTVSVYGIFEGRVAWLKTASSARALPPGPPGTALASSIGKSPDYYRFRATVGIIGLLQGAVDFAIVKASLTVRAEISATVIFETDRDTIINVSASVTVSVSVEIASFKIFGVRISISISFSFSAQISETFVISNGAQSAALAARMATAGPLSWHPLLAPRQETLTLPLYFAVQLTVRDHVPQFVATLNIATDRVTPDEPSPFERFARAFQEWTLAILDSERPMRTLDAARYCWEGDVRAVYDELRFVTARLGAVRDLSLTPAPGRALDYDNIIEFLTARFDFEIAAVPKSDGTAPPLACASFPMFAEIDLHVDGQQDGAIERSFRDYNPRSVEYRKRLRAYFDELQINFEDPRAEVGAAAAAADPSMAMLMFEDYCAFLVKEAQHELLELAEDALLEGREGALSLSLDDVDYKALAAKVSRFTQYGMRPPREIPDPDPRSWPGLPLDAMYALTGQQFPVRIAENMDYTVALQLRADWLKAGAEAPTFVVPWADADARAAIAQLGALDLKPDIGTPQSLAPLSSTPVVYQSNATTALLPAGAVQQKLLALSAQLLERTAGNNSVKVAVAVHADPPVAKSAFPAMRIDLTLTQVRELRDANVAPDGKSTAFARNVFQLGGADERARRQLTELLAVAGAVDGIQALHLVYQDAAGSERLVSDDVLAGTLVLKTDLSTTSHPSAERALRRHMRADELDDPVWAAWTGDVHQLLMLIWELSIVSSGGFYLRYDAADGGERLEKLFDDVETVAVTLVIVFAAADNTPELRCFHDSLLIADTAADGENATYDVSVPGAVDWDAAVPAGCIGFEVTRPNPNVAPASATDADMKTTVANLYNLLQFRILGEGDFVQSMWSIPIGPAESASGRQRRMRVPRPADVAPWTYRQSPSVYRFALSNMSDTAAEPNRYAGIGGEITLEFQVVDVFGNVLRDDRAEEDVAQVVYPSTLLYYDRIAAIGDWPGTELDFEVLPDSDLAALLSLPVRFEPDAVIPQYATKGETTPTPAQVEAAAAALVEYTRIFDQLRDPNTRIELGTTLLAQPIEVSSADLAGWVDTIRTWLAGVRADTPWPAPPKKLDLSASLPLADLDARPVMFTLEVWLRQWRTAFVNDDTARDNPAAKEVLSNVPPRIAEEPAAGDGDDSEPARYVAFARRLEAAYGGRLKAALGRATPIVQPARARIPLTQRDEEAPGSASVALWIVRYGTGGIELTPRADRIYYAPAPISTSLLSGDVAVRTYRRDWDGTDSDFTVGTRKLSGADLDLWAEDCLAAIDAFLDPTLAWAVVRIAPDEFTRVMTYKERIARTISAGIVPVLAGGPVPSDALRAEARDVFYQALLTTLAHAYDVSAVVQVPIDVALPDSFEVGVAQWLYGDVVESESLAASTDDVVNAGYTVSKLRLRPDDGAVTTLFTSAQPTGESHHAARLRYEISYAERGLGGAPPAEREYLPSSWFRFLLPGRSEQNTANTLSIDLGIVDIPVPLRRYPLPPAMISQSARPQYEAPATIQEVVRWRYGFEFRQEGAAQDRTHMRVEYNKPAEPAAADANLQSLFDALARFTCESSAIAEHFDAIVRAASAAEPTPEDLAVAKAAVQRFVDLVGAVADAWSAAPLDTATLRTSDPRLPYVVHEYWFEPADEHEKCGDVVPPRLEIRGRPGMRAQVIEEKRLRVRRMRAVGGPADWSTWPAIAGFQRATECEPEPAYQDAFYDAIEPAPRNTPGVLRSLSFPDLHILARQSATASAWIERNVHLVPGQATNPAFVYRSSEGTFSDPVLPFNDVLNAVPIDSVAGKTLFAKLVNFFDELMDAGGGVTRQRTGRAARTLLAVLHRIAARTPWRTDPEPVEPNQLIKVQVGYGFGVVPHPPNGNGLAAAGPLRATIPVLLSRDEPMSLASTGPTQLPAGFITDLAESLDQWYGEVHPADDDGELTIDLTLFAQRGTERRAVLRLRRVTLNTQPGSWWAS